MERGLAYLERQYGFKTKYHNGSISQQRVQLLRVVHMLDDYRIHKVLTRRYYASKNPLKLNDYFSKIHVDYILYLKGAELSNSTVTHCRSISWIGYNKLDRFKVSI